MALILGSETEALRPITGQRIVDVARSWLTTPFRHAGREKGLGVDCIGLLAGVAHELGITDYDDVRYSPWETDYDPGRVRRELERFCDLLPGDCLPACGDILLFRIAGVDRHVGIYTAEQTLIHAWSEAGFVWEIDFDRLWRRLHVATYRFRGLVKEGNEG